MAQPAHVLFAAIMLAATFVHWRILAAPSYAVGIDGGNWLALGHSLLGEHIRSGTIVYPPVVPLATVAAEYVFGTYGGLQAVALVAAAAPALGLYVLLYSWGAGWRGAVVAGFLASTAGTTEAMAWGGYPQLLAMGLLPLFVLALDRLLASSRWVAAIPTGLLFAAIAATSPLVALIAGVTACVFALIRYLLLRSAPVRNSIGHVAVAIPVAAVALAPLIPIYAGLLPGLTGTEQARGSHISLLTAFINVTGELSVFWWVCLLLAPLCVLLVRGPQQRFAVLTLSLVSASGALLAVSGEPRTAYFIPLGLLVGAAAWWLSTRRLPRWAQLTADVGLVSFLAIDMVVGAQYATLQRNYYTVVNAGVAAGLAKLDTVSRPNQLIAVSAGAHEWDIGWWVEGVARRPSIYAGDPFWLTFSDEKARNAQANQIFDPNITAQQSLERARAAGAPFLFIDKEWDGAARWESRLKVANGTPNIVFENQSVLIVSTAPLQGTQ